MIRWHVVFAGFGIAFLGMSLMMVGTKGQVEEEFDRERYQIGTGQCTVWVHRESMPLLEEMGLRGWVEACIERVK